MQYLIRVTCKHFEDGELKMFTKETKVRPKSKNKLKNLLYMSYPYGAWFPQLMLKDGKVKVNIVGEDTFVNTHPETFDVEFFYELIPYTPEIEVVEVPKVEAPVEALSHE